MRPVSTHRAVGRFLAATSFLSAIGAAQVELQIYDFASAIRETARVRTLAQRLSKQNLLYQLRLGDARQESLAETAAEIDRLIETLEKGNPAYTVPAPPNQEVRQQLDRLAGAWSALRAMALSSRSDYLRRAALSAQDRRGDPLLVRHFDHLARRVSREADELIELYADACVAAGYGERCRQATIAGQPATLTQRITKELVFVVAGIDTRSNREELRQHRDAYEAIIARARSTPFVSRAIASPESPSHAGGHIRRMWANVDERWTRLKSDVDLAIADRADQVDLSRALAAEVQLSEEMERLAGALRRRAVAERAGRATR